MFNGIPSYSDLSPSSEAFSISPFPSHDSVFTPQDDPIEVENYIDALNQIEICLSSEHMKTIVLRLKEGHRQQYAPTQYLLGECYRLGIGVEQDETIAKSYHQKAADQLYGPSLYVLGKSLLEGTLGFVKDEIQANEYLSRVESCCHFEMSQGDINAQCTLGAFFIYQQKNIVAAEELLQKASSQGHIPAKLELAKLLIKEAKGPYTEKALALLEQAANQGCTEASFMLYNWHSEGLYGLEKNIPKAVSILESLATHNASAQYQLAKRYAHGSGVIKDQTKAYLLFKEASLKNKQARVALAKCLSVGKGCKKNEKIAVEILRLCAIQKNTPALCTLGKWYAKGKSGLQQNTDASNQLYFQAAGLGSSLAKYIVGNIYAQGYGVEKDMAKAVSLWTEASQEQESHACYALSQLFEKGECVVQDDQKAVELLMQAAEKGRSRAQYNLGMRYKTGKGVPQDDEKAIELFTKAAHHNHPEALYALSQLQDKKTALGKEQYLMYLKKAAKAAHAEAMYTLGVYYLEEENQIKKGTDLIRTAALEKKLPQAQCHFSEFLAEYLVIQESLQIFDEETLTIRELAASLLLEAASQNYLPAMHKIGEYTKRGFLFQENQSEAVSWLEQAAEKGYIPSLRTLGIGYMSSYDEKIQEKAIACFQKARELGDAESTYNLSVCYALGKGTQKNRVRFLCLLDEAARHGYTKAIIELQKQKEIHAFCQILLPPKLRVDWWLS